MADERENSKPSVPGIHSLDRLPALHDLRRELVFQFLIPSPGLGHLPDNPVWGISNTLPDYEVGEAGLVHTIGFMPVHGLRTDGRSNKGKGVLNERNVTRY